MRDWSSWRHKAAGSAHRGHSPKSSCTTWQYWQITSHAASFMSYIHRRHTWLSIKPGFRKKAKRVKRKKKWKARIFAINQYLVKFAFRNIANSLEKNHQLLPSHWTLHWLRFTLSLPVTVKVYSCAKCSYSINDQIHHLIDSWNWYFRSMLLW